MVRSIPCHGIGCGFESRRPRNNMLQLPVYQPQTNFNPATAVNFLNPFLKLSPELAWLAVGLLVIVFLIASFVLFYHWKKFGFEKIAMAKAALFYSSVSITLLMITVISLAIYLNSL